MKNGWYRTFKSPLGSMEVNVLKWILEEWVVKMKTK
jgi:hypothetical protein